MKNQIANLKSVVSVITPFFNGDQFIGEAIDSVLAQTYPHWELLLIDDGSTDQSTAVAKHYAARHPDKIRYLEHPNHQNRGKSTSRNLGIQAARGKYLTFLDADDVFLPDKLERQTAILESHPEAGMVYGRTEYWYSWTGNPQDRRHDFISKLGVQPNAAYNPPHLLTRFLQDGGIVPCICSLLAHTRLVKEMAGFDESIQHMYEDQVFLAKICLGAPVFVEAGCGERYRQHNQSSSYIAINSGEYHPLKPNPSRLAFLTWLSQYLEEQNIYDDSLHKAVKKSFWPYRHPKLHRLISPAHYLMIYGKGYLDEIKRRLMPV